MVLFFTNDVPNTCKLKLDIPQEHINLINKDLQLDVENAGIIYFDEHDKYSKISKTKGNADSVMTPNNVINFHTHPISAYNQGQTVWGWPSGEDIRESIKFALAGNKAHLVFTVEGLYTIQISPCKIKKMKTLSDRQRGVLIFLIEEYFKTTHNFRCVTEVNKIVCKDDFITPYSYIDFVNKFDIHNLVNLKNTKLSSENIKNIGHTGIHSSENNNIGKYSGSEVPESFVQFPHIGFPETEGHEIICIKLIDYLTPDIIKEFCEIDDNGKERMSTITKNEIMNEIKLLENHFKNNKCTSKWNQSKPNTWFFLNFFPSDHYINHKHKSKNKYISPIPGQCDIKCIQVPFIRIFSTKKEGCSAKLIAKKHNFKQASKTSFGGFSIAALKSDISYLTSI